MTFKKHFMHQSEQQKPIEYQTFLLCFKSKVYIFSLFQGIAVTFQRLIFTNEDSEDYLIAVWKSTLHFLQYVLISGVILHKENMQCHF